MLFDSHGKAKIFIRENFRRKILGKYLFIFSLKTMTFLPKFDSTVVVTIE
jgi:hypothetical protein